MMAFFFFFLDARDLDDKYRKTSKTAWTNRKHGKTWVGAPHLGSDADSEVELNS